MNEFIYNVKQNKILATLFIICLIGIISILKIFIDELIPDFSILLFIFSFGLFFYGILYIHYFIQVISNDFKKDNKVVWVLIFIFVPFSVFLYLFIGKKYLEKKRKINKFILLIYVLFSLILGSIPYQIIKSWSNPKTNIINRAIQEDLNKVIRAYPNPLNLKQ
ncbi:MAG: Unknown protein [uncultured Campylobacterales bacterium]|uniref:Cardiolipin synthase N-terminal domain-containing protein n=1 Tax=uncultured Campylobacterales bacterium TaxID=352960 RepID=A0A6S6TCP4_9BACT|nr:MAG: Unknown protein [uncultured Campylobacterales bacterium]